ncbi:MAG: hypothetical protein KAG20_11335 [Cocleimonas sp.]|nr:hypothetical protein [Cocleimonas sp.]
MKIQTLLLASAIVITPLMTQAKVTSSHHHASTAKVTNIPQRGSNMKKVLHHYGKAKRITRSRGRVTKKWPRITRWEYGKFTVYFEKRIVLHTVIH